MFKSDPRYMQWDEVYDNEQIHADYHQYAQVDASKIRGWEARAIKDYPAYDMSEELPVEKSMANITYFVNHTRQTNQWAKPTIVHRSLKELIHENDDIPPEYEHGFMTSTRLRIEQGEKCGQLLQSRHGEQLLPSEFQYCRGMPSVSFPFGMVYFQVVIE